MLVSKLLLYKKGLRADLFFETSNVSFYKFADGDILTVSVKPGMASPLGIAEAPFKTSKWLLIEEDGIVSEWGHSNWTDMSMFDPKLLSINVKITEDHCQRYRKLLQEREPFFFEKILGLLNEEKYQDLVGLGPGLTPLGDDVLSGMIVAGFDFSGDFHTSEISLQQLRHAKEKLVPYPVKLFLESGNEEPLLEMGNTSGLGWAFGIAHRLEGCV